MTDVEKKKAHAAALVVKLQELATEITTHEAGLWFGGYPPLFVQIQNFTDHISGQLRLVFELPPEEETE